MQRSPRAACLTRHPTQVPLGLLTETRLVMTDQAVGTSAGTSAGHVARDANFDGMDRLHSKTDASCRCLNRIHDSPGETSARKAGDPDDQIRVLEYSDQPRSTTEYSTQCIDGPTTISTISRRVALAVETDCAEGKRWRAPCSGE